MRIAFTSCQDVVRDAEQRAWNVLATEQPDHIVLLGDNIYMDYKFDSRHHSRRQVRKMSLPEFSKLMHSRYEAQWRVASFQAAIRVPGVEVHAIWDDHDFAWNNSRSGPGHEGAKDYVSPERRRLSRRLFEQYRLALQEMPERPEHYPVNPCPDGVVPAAEDLGGVQDTVDLAPKIRLHLLDGRSFRQSLGGIFAAHFGNRHPDLLGEPQRASLAAALLPQPGINLLASGTTLEDWAKYVDLAWLQAQAVNHRIVVLSGDVHYFDFKNAGGITELIASAIAKPPGVTKLAKRKTEVFGILDIDEANNNQMTATFWHEGNRVMHHTF